MKILHSADWHLGKKLEKRSRLEEQELFLQDFCKMADDNDVDLVIIAGDIFDQTMPPIEAEKLLYNYLKKLSNNGERLSLVIAGNHDAPEKIVATAPLAMEHGIISVGTPLTVVPIGEYGKHKVVNSAQGMVEVEINGEKAVIITVPYVNETRLNEVFSVDMASDEEKAHSYNDRIKTLFTDLAEYYRDDTINLATSHIFTVGSLPEGSERNLGGAYMCNPDCFPEKAQYVALGHIHKPLIVEVFGKTHEKIQYSGSPLQYNKREIGYEKQCILVEVYLQKDAIITPIPVTIHRPIEIWTFDNVDEAIKTCEEKKDYNCHAYVEINSTEPILPDQLKAINSANKNIISVQYFIDNTDSTDEYEELEDFEDLDLVTVYENFHKKTYDSKPSQEIIDLLTAIDNDEKIEQIDIEKFKLELNDEVTLDESN